jgi:hypothetical protein
VSPLIVILTSFTEELQLEMETNTAELSALREQLKHTDSLETRIKELLKKNSLQEQQLALVCQSPLSRHSCHSTAVRAEPLTGRQPVDS